MDPDKTLDTAPDGSAGQMSQWTQVAAQPTHISVIPNDSTAHGPMDINMDSGRGTGHQHLHVVM